MALYRHLTPPRPRQLSRRRPDRHGFPVRFKSKAGDTCIKWDIRNTTGPWRERSRIAAGRFVPRTADESVSPCSISPFEVGSSVNIRAFRLSPIHLHILWRRVTRRAWVQGCANRHGALPIASQQMRWNRGAFGHRVFRRRAQYHAASQVAIHPQTRIDGLFHCHGLPHTQSAQQGLPGERKQLFSRRIHMLRRSRKSTSFSGL